MCIVHFTSSLLLLDSLGILDFLSEEGHVLGHGGEMLQILGFKLRVFVDVVLGELLLNFLLFVVHEGIQLFNIDLPLGEIDIRVKLGVYH